MRAKLSPPRAGDFEVQRTEVCERIFAAGSASLVLLRAPAGFGKTTTMLQVRERFLQTGLPTAWLTLDRGDNDLGRFLFALAQALAPLVPGLPGPDAAGPAADSLAFDLIDRIAAHPAPFALFLDEFETLQNPSALAIVAELIDQLPRGAQLIVGSRGVPELGLGRLRARGRLLEVDATQLRFSEVEAEAFLTRRGLSLTLENRQQLYSGTEGWAAALWLASLSLEGRADADQFIASFSGSHAAVVDYLAEDVLARQSDELRDFLLRTSVLSELNPSLCDTVCERTDSAQLLRRLEQAHLFLIPLQADHSQYRYHAMFAEFLRSELARRDPRRVPALHAAASQWFARHDRPVPAIEHALAAGDQSVALQLLHLHAQSLLDDGRVQLLARWLDPMLAAGELDSHPMLQVVHAWAICFARGPRAAGHLLERLEQRADSDPMVRAHRMAMKPLFMALGDRTEEAIPLAVEALAAMPAHAGFVHAFLEVTLANIALVAGRFQEARRFADAARSRQPLHSSNFNLAMSEATDAAVDLMQGRLRKAIAGLRIAVSAGPLDAARTTNGNALAGVPLASALYEAGQLEQAERLLAVYVPLIRRVYIPDQLIIAHVVAARIARERADTERAEQLLGELEHIGHRNGLPRVVATARLERVRVLMVEDKLARARDELDRCGDAGLWARVARMAHPANEVESHDVALARWMIRAGKATEAIAMLRPELDACERAQRERRVLTLRLLLAQALYRDSQRNKAMRLLAKAVRMAAGEGYVRAFLDEGPLVPVMLEELRAAPDLLVQEAGALAVAFLDRLLLAPPPPRSATAAAQVATESASTSQLSRKELQVLGLAAEGLTNDEIAERLFVAETTVRTHLRNVNVKLDTRSRVEAIAMARRQGLLR